MISLMKFEPYPLCDLYCSLLLPLPHLPFYTTSTTYPYPNPTPYTATSLHSKSLCKIMARASRGANKMHPLSWGGGGGGGAQTEKIHKNFFVGFHDFFYRVGMRSGVWPKGERVTLFSLIQNNNFYKNQVKEVWTTVASTVAAKVFLTKICRK